MNAQLPMPITAPFSKSQRASIANLMARAARTEIMPRFRRLDSGAVSTKTGPMDLVTEADVAAEDMIRRGLQIAFPNAVIVGEEAAERDPDYRKALAEAELGFLIDPVDGTWNFAHGMPLFGSMIAVCRFGRPVFGLIYDPVGQDFIWADIDTEARWHPRQGHVRRLHTRKDTAIGDLMGYVELGFMPQPHKRAAVKALMEFRHFSTLRCSAHQYRLLAEGAVDFSLAIKLNPWDHAAGVLICQKAGGHAAMLDGTPYTTSADRGYLLSAGDEATWNVVADHLSALLEPVG